MTVGLAFVHLVGDCCIFLVSLLGVPAGGAGVVGTNVKSMCPALVHVVEVAFVSFALWGSDAVDCFGGFTVGVWLRLCLCLCLRCHCHCSCELDNLVTER